MAKAIMIQGTMSNAGKSLLCAGLCRVFSRRGLKVAPFKSQNMALNSYITRQGLEMGRAQAVQAEAACVEPDVRMNPVLLKPVTHMGSQVILMGEVLGNYAAADYYKSKHTLLPAIKKAYFSLAAQNDIMVIEGAGSPAEINLKEGDFVNMGMARIARAPVLLVGDIDRGGVFAQLYGTIALLEPREQEMVKATVINKFRGDVSLLQSGLTMLTQLTHKPVAGVLPMLNVDIEEEDSLSERLNRVKSKEGIDIAVIRLPHISNFTDLGALEAAGASVRTVQSPEELGKPALTILPGTKNTVSDLKWLWERGLGRAVQELAASGNAVFGICGGYQMLGERVTDAIGAEGGGETAGLGLLPCVTRFTAEKRRTRVEGRVLPCSGILAPLSGATVEGYEIHMGETELLESAAPLVTLDGGKTDGCFKGSVYGSYLHGFFDSVLCRERLWKALGKGGERPIGDYKAYREKQYDILADAVEQNLNMALIGEILDKGLQ